MGYILARVGVVMLIVGLVLIGLGMSSALVKQGGYNFFGSDNPNVGGGIAAGGAFLALMAAPILMSEHEDYKNDVFRNPALTKME